LFSREELDEWLFDGCSDDYRIWELKSDSIIEVEVETITTHKLVPITRVRPKASCYELYEKRRREKGE
jgi:hypothetical protein